MQIQLLYTDDCVHLDKARATLHEALSEEGINAYVEEIRVTSQEEARRRGFSGSPTILINGRDIAPGGLPKLGCRTFRGRNGESQPWPHPETVRWALRANLTPVGCCG